MPCRRSTPTTRRTDEHLIEELGDLLYQIEFHATIAEQEGRFTIADVAAGVHDKLVRRHPHVFGATGRHVDLDTAEVLANWDDIKRAEKQRTSVFDGIPRSMPSLAYAAKVGAKASKVGFDWPDVERCVPEDRRGDRRAARRDDRRRRAARRAARRTRRPAVRRRQRRPPSRASIRSSHCAPRPTSSAPGSRASNDWRPSVGIDLRGADLATLDALWDEVKAAE